MLSRLRERAAAPDPKRLGALAGTFALAFSVVACAGIADDGKPKIIAATPASVEIECIGIVRNCESAQAVADAAEAHCRQFGLHAQETDVARAPSGNERALFSCVPLGAATPRPAAGLH